MLAVLVTLTACAGGNQAVKAIRERGALRVGVKVDVPHFGYLNPETSQIEGLEVDLAKEIAKGIFGSEKAVKLTPLTAQTRGPMLNNGEIDIAIATFTITDERKKTFNFTTPYFTDEIGLLVHEESQISSFADISAKTVGVVQSGTARDTIASEAEKRGYLVAIKEFASYPEVKAALDAHQINAFAADKSILTGYKDDACVVLEEGLSPQVYGIATALDNKGLAAYMDGVVKSMIKDGRLEQIFEKWHVSSKNQ